MGRDVSHAWDLLPRPLKIAPAMLAGLIGAGLTTAFCLAIAAWLPEHGVAIFYMLAVLALAVTYGMLAGIATATAAFLSYNFFFVQPAYTFTISDPRDVFALVVFFAVAVATGSLAGRLREVAEQARERSDSLETLNVLAIQLSSAMSEGDVASMLVSQANKVAGAPASLLRPAGSDLSIWMQSDGAPTLDTADWQAARRAASTKLNVYPAADGQPGSQWEFRPVPVRGSVVAVLGLNLVRSDDAKDATLDAMVHQTAVALERLSLANEKGAAEREAEIERLRSALLAAVSHDIKTPLAAIQGAATSLRELGSKMSDASKAELEGTIEEESARLSRFVTNMLDMMRFQSGPPAVSMTWIDLADTLGATVMHARKVLPTANLRLEATTSPAIVLGDELLLERVFLNVIENSANASEPGREIKVALHRREHAYQVVVEDFGTGIAANDMPRIFEKFYRAAGTKSRGSGLGLSICKEVMNALGGTISVESPVHGASGTRVTLHFPVAEVPLGPGDVA